MTLTNKTIIRIGKAIDFVEDNLDKKLLLEEVAKQAYFSPYHFHRLFKIVTKETLKRFYFQKKNRKSCTLFITSKRENHYRSFRISRFF